MSIESRGQISHLDSKTFLTCGALATGRGLILTCCTHPLDVLKIKIQDSPNPPKISILVREIFREKGMSGFYQGLVPQINRLMLKEWWRWPAIIYLPAFFERNYSLSPIVSQIMTGLFVSTLDAGTTAPFERYRIRSITGTLPPPEKGFSKRFSRVFKGGWEGFTPFWIKSSVGWVSFSISQRVMRDGYKNITKKTELGALDLAIVGTGVACVVSACLAPFDLANTRGQSRGISIKDLWHSSKKMTGNKIMRQFWKGAPLQALIFSIHNITSVALIDKLSKS